MLLSLTRWLLIATLPVLLCLAPGASPMTSPPPLLDLFPNCASTCIENFILSEYPKDACLTGCDLTYLCTTNTTSGYTLGEAALRCSLAMCSMEVALSYSSYSVCESIHGALPRTHATIVATIMPIAASTTSISATHPGTSGVSSTITSDPTGTQTDNIPTTTATFRSPVSVTSSAHESSSTSNGHSHPSSSTTSNPSSAESSGGSNLDPAAVIGVSVASGVSAFFILCVIIFLCCRRIRRKNQQERDQDFFEIGGVMTEPPDFNSPRKPPTLAANISTSTLGTDSESTRLVSPPIAPYQNPAVFVTRPDSDYFYGPVTGDSVDRAGFPPTSNPDFEVASSESSRTVSDLLPDKPTYELYPRPLRWSQHKRSRPISGETLFEESPGEPGNSFGYPHQQFNFSSLAGQHDNNRPHYRRPMPGLPANPRAMLNGFGRGRGDIFAMKGQDHRRKPTFENVKENVNLSRQAPLFSHPLHRSPNAHRLDQDSGLNNYWEAPGFGFVATRVASSRNAARNSYHSVEANMSSLDELGPEFETIDTNENRESRRASRHSGNFRPLTPVREIKTPTGEPQKPNDCGPSGENTLMPYPQAPFPGTLNPGREIVSRPRIVRRDDIKRVQIRRGRPQPNGLPVPYSPDDYWFGHGLALLSEPQRPGDSGSSRGFRYGSERLMGHMPKKKRSPLERNLTPSRKGSDLILQVD